MKEKDLKFLWGRSAGRCAMPDCRKQLCPYPHPGTILGHTAHIVAESSSGPRGDYTIPQEQRNSYSNLVLLCPEHHIIIDDQPEKWTVEVLGKIKNDHEKWVKEQLRTGILQPEVEAIIRKIDRLHERNRLLHVLFALNLGNALFLQALQESDDAIWFNCNAGAKFRDEFLEFLDELFGNSRSTPFLFEMLDALVAFPDGYESYHKEIRNPPLKKPDVPILIQEATVVKDGEDFFLEGGERIPLPFLPLKNGYIWGRDDRTGLPNSVKDEPCDEYWGAYFWIRPNGLRIAIMGIGVLDPLEVLNGTAIWYSRKDRRPFLGVRRAKIATEQMNQQMHQAVKKAYANAITKFSQWPKKRK